ncbi:MAG: hypothetical protein K2W82_17330 [Candidatus Obscuribacterales bacterium]|nr:hypothetical protein [Candidatus Obscuribacterales bacterium]
MLKASATQPASQTRPPIHFAIVYAPGGGTVEDDWQAHLAQARKTGCPTCCISPDVSSAFNLSKAMGLDL